MSDGRILVSSRCVSCKHKTSHWVSVHKVASSSLLHAEKPSIFCVSTVNAEALTEVSPVKDRFEELYGIFSTGVGKIS